MIASTEWRGPQTVQVFLVGVSAVALDELGDLVVRGVVRDVERGVAWKMKSNSNNDTSSATIFQTFLLEELKWHSKESLKSVIVGGGLLIMSL